jgi:hypothetical protein
MMTKMTSSEKGFWGSSASTSEHSARFFLMKDLHKKVSGTVFVWRLGKEKVQTHFLISPPLIAIFTVSSANCSDKGFHLSTKKSFQHKKTAGALHERKTPQILGNGNRRGCRGNNGYHSFPESVELTQKLIKSRLSLID